MFYALIQLGDLAILGTLGLFLVFYVLTWTILGIRLSQSKKYHPSVVPERTKQSVSVVIPVADEHPNVLRNVLTHIYSEVKEREYEIIIVLNNHYSKETRKVAKDFEMDHQHVEVIETNMEGKRNAIAIGVNKSIKDFTILLDSDSIITLGSLPEIMAPFFSPKVGGVVPRQEIFDRNGSLMRRLCDWYEDIRFHNTTPGLSYHRSIPCLIGRLYVVRTHLLKKYMPQFVQQYVMGRRMETGDDRVLTSMLLQDGYETVYASDALVLTDSPDTLWKFAKQRLRWSRSSFRETLLSIGWLWKHPYAFFVMWADILLRWLFFAVVTLFLYRVISGNMPVHFIDLSWAWYLTIGVLGFFVSGLLKQMPHLSRYPEDWKYTPLFLLLNLFVLFPVEIYGNLTPLKQGWLTRREK